MDGWYLRNLRCSKVAFEKIVANVDARWLHVNLPLHHNTVFSIKDRVAVTIHYLTHSDGFAASGQVFGMSSTRAHGYVSEIVAVIMTYMNHAVRLPKSPAEWLEVARGFEQMGGIPNVVGVIDGSLLPVKRFGDHEGWYCRKGFPAFNMQGVVDYKLRFMSFSIRSGSQNDKSLFNRSSFGVHVHKIIPPGCYFLADAGYKLFQHIMTPYEIRHGMPVKESHYNDIHSRTRSTVERAFGRWKNKFRIFKSPLEHRTPEGICRVHALNDLARR
ncbi:hypothetical protein AeMF1_018731 [Aphanomyces euteiches]|nr:hypothetical protein AeMF1_018731 [Aphanomyces euteiches]